jgi:hypothetical protein
MTVAGLLALRLCDDDTIFERKERRKRNSHKERGKEGTKIIKATFAHKKWISDADR